MLGLGAFKVCIKNLGRWTGQDIGRIDSDMKGPSVPAGGTSIPKTRRPKGPFGSPAPQGA